MSCHMLHCSQNRVYPGNVTPMGLGNQGIISNRKEQEIRILNVSKTLSGKIVN